MDADYSVLDNASGKMCYKLNTRYLISVAVKELFCRHKHLQLICRYSTGSLHCTTVRKMWRDY